MFQSLAVPAFEIMIVAAVLDLMCAGCLRHNFWRPAELKFHRMALGVAPIIYLLVLSIVVPTCYVVSGVVFAGLLLTLAVALDLSARRYFDQSIAEVLLHLPVKFSSLLQRKTAAGYLRQYVPFYYYMPVPVAGALAWAMLRGVAHPTAGAALMAAALFESVVVIRSRGHGTAPTDLCDIEKAILKLGAAAPPRPSRQPRARYQPPAMTSHHLRRLVLTMMQG